MYLDTRGGGLITQKSVSQYRPILGVTKSQDTQCKVSAMWSPQLLKVTTNDQQQQNRDETLKRDLQRTASKEEDLAQGTYRKVKTFGWAIVGNASYSRRNEPWSLQQLLTQFPFPE